MGLIDRALGGGETVGRVGEAAEGLTEVFVPNATRAMELAADIHQATLATAAAEFQFSGDNWFDRMINGINRLPRPFLALGTLGLFIYAMRDPVGFAERMVGLQEVPEPLWWLLGVIVSFYFGARHQVKSQEFQREIAGTVSRVPEVVRNIDDIREALPAEHSPAAAPQAVLLAPVKEADAEANAALADWTGGRR